MNLKKTVTAIIFMNMVAGMTSLFPALAADRIIPGDINCNGAVNIIDR